MRNKLLGFAFVLFLLPTATEAQSVTEYRLGIYIQGGLSPITSVSLPVSAFVCGQPKVAVTGTQVNPSRMRMDDPTNAALDCVYVDPGTGPLLALPFNPTTIYEGTLRAANTAGVSVESARSNPFSRPGTIPPAPVGLRIGG